MQYSISEDVPTSWDPIIESFLTMSEHSIEFQNSPEIYDINISVRHGLLYINYKGGDIRIDSFAHFAKELSAKFCTECGAVSTRTIFESPKCDDCY